MASNRARAPLSFALPHTSDPWRSLVSVIASHTKNEVGASGGGGRNVICANFTDSSLHPLTSSDGVVQAGIEAELGGLSPVSPETQAMRPASPNAIRDTPLRIVGIT